MSSHSGYSNAYTASTQTNYFFEVAAAAEASESGTNPTESPLHGALDRFAQFFVAPLFLSETLDRELRAVDSENKKNLQNDTWRLSQLNKSLSNPDYPYQHFSTGNLQTLRDEPKKRGVEIRKAFIQFYEKHYSANRMKLVVLGKESLDVLESWVADLFANVRNQDLPQNRWDGVQPYTRKELLTQVFAKPVMDSRSLDIYFPYQDEEDLYRTHPSRYIGHLIGHEGPGSILAYIKAKGWANGLSAGAMPVGPGTAFFTISIRLTEDGLIKYREIVKTVFQYIALLRETPPQKWIVDEVKGMAEVDFRFKQKSPASSFTSRLSSEMQKPLPREWLLSGSRLIREFDAQAIENAMTFLRTDNYRLTIVSKSFPGDWDQKEQWYGTEYRIEKIPSDFQNAIHETAKGTSQDRPSELHLPHVNEFVPTRLTVEKKEVDKPAKAPKLIRKDAGFRTWWKKDDQFWVPKASISIVLRSPLTSVTPMNTVKTILYCDLVCDTLDEYSYDAEIAGLEYSLHATSLGLELEFDGYNDKMPVLLEKVLVSMRDLEIKSARFDILKERLLRGFQNWDFHQPYKQVGDFTRWLGSEKGWINEQYLAEVPHVTPEDVTSFFPQLLRQAHVELSATGNLYKEDVLRITDLIDSTLKPIPLPQSQWQTRRNLILPPGSDYTYSRPLKDPANVNNCIEYYLRVGPYSDLLLRAHLLLFSQLTDEQGFDQLRTKEQLGYIVWTGTKLTETTMGYRVIIQSERDPIYLENRINAFLAQAGTKLASMTDAEFEGHRKSLINKRLEKVKNLDQESSRFWNYISSEYFNFYQVDVDVQNISTLTKSDLQAFFAHYIDPTASETRAKLSVYMVAQTKPEELAKDMAPSEQKEKLVALISKYLSSLGAPVNDALLAECYTDVDVSMGDQDAILAALGSYLEKDPTISSSISEEQSKEVLEQGRILLVGILPTLGIQVQVASPVDGEITEQEEDFPPVPDVKQTTFIENVMMWKAGLSAGPGASPLEDLTQFEELGSKL